MRQCFERAVAMIEAHPEIPFIFSRSTAWSFHIVEQQCPALFKKVKHYVQQGRIALCGGQWVEPDHMIPGGEALVRQAALGQWYFLEKFGKTARVCWAIDNFAHAGSLPQILRKAGLDGYYLSRCLPMDAHGQPRRQFRWRGQDGSELLAFKLQNLETLDDAAIRTLVRERDADGLPALLIKANDMYADRRVIMHPDWVPQPGRIAAEPDLPDCRWSAPDDILDDMTHYRDQLPVAEGELGFEYTGTYTTDGRYKRKNRLLENLLPDAEKVACWAALHGFPYPAAQLKQAWADLCLNHFHDLSCGSSFGEVLDEADRLNTEIENRATWVRDQALAFLCDRMHAEPHPQDIPGDRMAVFNLLSFEHTAAARIPKADAAPVHYVDASGAPVPSQAIEAPDGGRFDVILHTSRGLGVHLYQRLPGALTDTPEPPIASGNGLENAFVRVEIDPLTGDIVRLLDKVQQTEYLTADGRGNRLELLREANLSPHPAWCTMEPWWIMYTGERLASPFTVDVRLRETGPVRGCIRVSRRGALHPDLPETVIVQDIVLYRHSPLLHFETHGAWHAERLMLKARFDLPFTATRVDADAPYGVAERRLPQHLDNRVSQTVGVGEEWKADADLPPEPDRPMQTWLDVGNGTQGLLVLNNGKYGYDADTGQVGISLMRAPNMRPWRKDILGLGPFAFSYAVMPHAGDWRAINAPQQGQTFNHETLVRPVQSGVDDLAGCQWWDLRDSAPLPIDRQLLTLRDPGVQATALKRAEDGDGLILRLVECLGDAHTVDLDFNRLIESVEVTDLLERPLQAASAPVIRAGKTLEIHLSAHEIKTLRLRLNHSADGLVAISE